MADQSSQKPGGSSGQIRLVHSSPERKSANNNAAAKAAAKALRDAPVYFNKQELAQLLNVYGKHVAGGDWRDYAMDFFKDRAVFSIFRHTSEQPLFVIEKQPKLRMKQGQYLVINQAGRVLKRGHDLRQVLKVFESRQFAVN